MESWGKFKGTRVKDVLGDWIGYFAPLLVHQCKCINPRPRWDSNSLHHEAKQYIKSAFSGFEKPRVCIFSNLSVTIKLSPSIMDSIVAWNFSLETSSTVKLRLPTWTGTRKHAIQCVNFINTTHCPHLREIGLKKNDYFTSTTPVFSSHMNCKSSWTRCSRDHSSCSNITHRASTESII